MEKRVSVFGSSRPKPRESEYETARHLGRALGAAGFTVFTGGYIGTMEAVSMGAAESGGHVVGVTCEEIEAWRPVGPNPWVQEEKRASTILERLSILIGECDAAIALPGGVGTLTEISLMWTLLSIKAISPCPLILIGNGWKNSFYTLFQDQDRFIAEADRKLLSFVPDVNSAICLLQFNF